MRSWLKNCSSWRRLASVASSMCCGYTQGSTGCGPSASAPLCWVLRAGSDMGHLKTPICYDFETFPIAGWPEYPPRPVGFSILLPGKKPKYWAFGHPTANNCTEADAKNALGQAYELAHRAKCGLLCHNSKFDMHVAERHWCLALPPWELIHDSMFLIFLHDPHS